MSKLSIVEWSGGDWVAYYVDGKWEGEGHDMGKHDWLDLIKNHAITEVEEFEYKYFYNYDNPDKVYYTHAPGDRLDDFIDGDLKRVG